MPSLSYAAQLLVEGKNDKHVVWALCQQHNVPENFTVEMPSSDTGGIDELLESIPVRLKISRLHALGIVLDADQDLQERWRAVRQRIINFGYVQVPEQPSAQGTIIINQGKPRVGIWLMPNNELSGMLEDFVAYLIPEGDPLALKAIAILENIEKDGINKYSQIHHSKAFIHTWLAWQQNPGQPMGTSITSRVLDHENLIAVSFVNWLIGLFAPDTEAPPA